MAPIYEKQQEITFDKLINIIPNNILKFGNRDRKNKIKENFNNGFIHSSFTDKRSILHYSEVLKEMDETKEGKIKRKTNGFANFNMMKKGDVRTIVYYSYKDINNPRSLVVFCRTLTRK